MSVKVSAWVWHDVAEEVGGNDLVVLLALADIANDNGECVFVTSKEEATQAALAKKARVSKRTFQRVVERLENAGLLSITRGSQHSTNTYRLLIQGGQIVTSGDSRVDKTDIQSGQNEHPEVTTVSPHRDVLRKNVVKREATSIPDDFSVVPSMLVWAVENAPAVNVDRETAKFVDYWREGDGRGRKHNSWEITWRNWLRSAQDREERFGWKAPDAEVVALAESENVTVQREAREHAEQKAVWCAERGVTVPEFDRRHHEPGFVEMLNARVRVAVNE